MLPYSGDHALDEPDAVFGFRSLIIGIEPFSISPDIHIKDGGLDEVRMFFGNDGLFRRVHAAHG